MPHDINGNLLQPGDMVYIPAKVVAVHQTEDYCNLDVELRPMPPNDTPMRLSQLNTRQVQKVTPTNK